MKILPTVDTELLQILVGSCTVLYRP